MKAARAFSSHAATLRRMRRRILASSGSEHVEGDVLDDCEVERRVVGSHAAFVVAEDHVEHPVEAVVSRPEGFRLRPLAERCGSLSNSHRSHQANPPTVPLCQCTNRCGCFSAMRSRSRLARVLCPLSRLNLRIAQATNVMLKCLKTGYIAEG